MSWYIEEKLQIENRNQATLTEMRKFLTLWECVCGTCPVCIACLDVATQLEEEE